MEISTINVSDYVKILATFHNLTDERFKCKEAEKFLSNRSSAEVDIKMRKILKGCDKITVEPKIEIDGFNFHTCLCNQQFQHPTIGQLFEIQRNYDKGVMPFSGGTLEQPAQIMEIIQLISRLNNEYELEMHKKQQSKG